MKKVVIGYIFAGPEFGEDEYLFRKHAKKRNVELIFLDIFEGMQIKEIKKKIEDCKIILNSSAEDFAIEFSKTVESLGKKVIDSTESFYYIEDKWIFYLKCFEKKIPVPRTILLSEKFNVLKEELKEFNNWPVVLKRVEGTSGEFVEKAENLKEAVSVIKNLWKKGSQRLPLIAQELILSPCYRVTVIDSKIVQTTLKNNHGWKKTGVYEKRNKRFLVDDELKKIVEELVKLTKIRVLGIDLLKKDGKWVVLEVNTAPALDFIGTQRDQIVGEVLKFLIKEAKKN